MAGIINVEINGTAHKVEKPQGLTLLKYLRDHLGLMGAKNGCNQGHCGTCTVIVNGKAKRACLVQLSKLAGSKIETIENLSSNGYLHPLQEAFMTEGASQCGFCTPGMIMAAKAMLDTNPNPSDEEIKKALRFNLCRCTGYAAIFRAVRLAAHLMRLEKTEFKEDEKAGTMEENGVGFSPLKKGALPRVTGSPLYADDLKFKNMIYGKLLLSEHPFAMIKMIDPRKALKRPGVITVLTARDIPGRNGFGLLNPHQPVLANDIVRYIGDPVALIFAESEEAASAALNYVEVEYEPLQGVFSPEQGMKEDALSIHPGGNIMHHVSVRKGDVDKAFAEADVIIEGVYTTPMIEHAYLEPEAAVAKLEDNGVINVWTASQGSHAFREMIAASLNLPEEKVRIIYTPAGGAFGGKEEPTVQIHCALGAMVTGRPVKMTLTRRESMIISTKRHWEQIYYRHGATGGGKVIAVEARVIADAGAYDSLSKPMVFRSAVVTAGPYDIPNVKTDAYGIYTNHPPGGAFRGFGSTQVAFGAEQQMDRLARALNIGPFELRKMNGLAPGKTTITGQVIKSDCGYFKTLVEVEISLNKYLNKLPQPAPGKKIGIGIASAYKNVGLGAGKRDKAGAKIEIDHQGNVLLKVGAIDMGQGSDTILAQLAANGTGIAYEDFLVISSDTSQTPEGGVTTASRQTYISGYAVLGAAQKFTTVFRECLEKAFTLNTGEYELVRGGLRVFRTKNNLDHNQDFADVAADYISYQNVAIAAEKLGIILTGEFVYTAPITYPLRKQADHEPGVPPDEYDIHFAYCYGTQAAVVEVDETTGEVKVLKIIAAQDLGKAIHPQNCHCQIEGAIVMGMGYGLSEEFVLENGIISTDNLAKLKLPRITDMPEIETILVEEESDGPYGAKGMGELPINPTAPAIINAIYDAVGVRITDLPATREKILAELKNNDRE